MLKNLLCFRRKSANVNQTLSNVLAAAGTTMFTSRHELKKIKKLKIPREDIPMVHASLAGLGMCAVMSSLVIAVENLGLDSKTSQSIIDQIRKDTQKAFFQQLTEDGMPIHVITYISNDIILPLCEHIPRYIDETILEMDSDTKYSDPFYNWGILGMLLRQALGAEKVYEIIKADVLGFFPVRLFIDGMFTNALEVMPGTFEELLRSPMGNEYGI